MRRCATSLRPVRPLARTHAAFQRLREGVGDVEAGLLADLDKAGRTGDVDLGQVVAYHVEPDDEQTLGRERAPDRFGDLAVTRGKRARYAATAAGTWRATCWASTSLT